MYMKLSIITINYNNAAGLRKTLASVAAQTYRDIEHIIVDGKSTDNSVDIIKDYYHRFEIGDLRLENVIWSSEPDKGIYNAMNKGIDIALGRRIVNSFNRSELVEDKNKVLSEYVFILNSGDALASPDVIQRMMDILNDGMSRADALNEPLTLNDEMQILMGNIVHVYGEGRKERERKRAKVSDLTPRPMEASMLTFYRGTMPHDAAFVRRDLFEKYGYFDELMKICADWKLYLNMIALGGVVPMYVDVDVVDFDMSGVSNTNNERRLAERRAYLEKVLPAVILKDYDTYAGDITIMQRLHRHPWAFRLTRLLERILFKIEKLKKC